VSGPIWEETANNSQGQTWKVHTDPKDMTGKKLTNASSEGTLLTANALRQIFEKARQEAERQQRKREDAIWEDMPNMPY
jgi:hypothetical protein